MISARTTRAKGRAGRREGSSGIGKVNWHELSMADELARCLEDIDSGRPMTSVISALKAEPAKEIAPLLEIAELLRLRKYAIQYNYL